MSQALLPRFPHSITWVFDPGASNASRPCYCKAFESGTPTVPLTLLPTYPTAVNIIYHSRSRSFSRAQLSSLLQSIFALFRRLLLPSGSTPTGSLFLCLAVLVPQPTAPGTSTQSVLDFYTSIWQFYSDQLHLAVLPRPSSLFLCLAILPRPTAPGGSTPTSFYSCALQFYPNQLHLVVLPQQVLVLGDSTPTNCTWRSYPNLFLFSVPCGFTLTKFNWRFYLYQFFILAPSCSISPSVQLAVLPWPILLKPSQVVLPWPAWLFALHLAVLPWPAQFIT